MLRKHNGGGGGGGEQGQTSVTEIEKRITSNSTIIAANSPASTSSPSKLLPDTLLPTLYDLRTWDRSWASADAYVGVGVDGPYRNENESAREEVKVCATTQMKRHSARHRQSKGAQATGAAAVRWQRKPAASHPSSRGNQYCSSYCRSRQTQPHRRDVVFIT